MVSSGTVVFLVDKIALRQRRNRPGRSGAVCFEQSLLDFLKENLGERRRHSIADLFLDSPGTELVLQGKPLQAGVLSKSEAPLPRGVVVASAVARDACAQWLICRVRRLVSFSCRIRIMVRETFRYCGDNVLDSHEWRQAAETVAMSWLGKYW